MKYIDVADAMKVCGVSADRVKDMKVNGQRIYDKRVKMIRADLFEDIVERKKIIPPKWFKNIPGEAG